MNFLAFGSATTTVLHQHVPLETLHAHLQMVNAWLFVAALASLYPLYHSWRDGRDKWLNLGLTLVFSISSWLLWVWCHEVEFWHL